MTKVYDNNKTLNEKILKGVNTLANNVAATLGPKGRNVILQSKEGRPIITKDGVTVAKFVELEDPFENLGAQVVKQASSVTNTTAGDGTTTATVLARAILEYSQKHLAAGASPVDMKRGMDKAVTSIIESLDSQAKPIASEDEIANIASISANNDREIGKLVALAVTSAGKNGAITIEEAKSLETSLDLVEGFQFRSGYLSNSFVTDQQRGVFDYNEPYILVTDQNVDQVEDLLPILEQVAREGKPLVIIAENVEGQALAALIMNTVRGTMKVAAIKAPHYGEERRNTLSDLAIATGATIASRTTGLHLKDMKLEHLGNAKRVEASKVVTTIVNGKGNLQAVQERIDLLSAELEVIEDMQVAELTQSRITRLSSGVAIIKVGGTTEVEMIERKHRIEDSLAAVNSAREEGIVPGGGVALLRSVSCLDDIEVENKDQQAGVDVIREAIVEPIRQMAKNAGLSPDLIVNEVENSEGTTGFDFASGSLTDMFESGILDPKKVTKNALQNAVSASGTLITTNHAIVELP